MNFTRPLNEVEALPPFPFFEEEKKRKKKRENRFDLGTCKIKPKHASDEKLDRRSLRHATL